MDFSFTPEQEAIRDTVRRFCKTRLAPRYREREQEGRLEPELFRDMGELGLIGAGLPEEFGGQGLDSVTVGIIVEEIAHGDLNAAYIPMLASLNGAILAHHAPPDVAREVLPKLCRGEVWIALALTEPDTGSDAARLKVRAVRDGDRFVLNGEKTSISFADQAQLCIVFARTGTEEEGSGGVSAFLVDLQQPGVTRTRFEDMGERAVGRGSIFFQDVAVPAAMMLGDEGRGFSQVMRGFDFSRATPGAILAHHAPPDVAREVLPKLCRGEVWIALALTEPDTGSDAARLKVRAVRDGDRFVLNGEKTSISFADQAQLCIVFARTGTEEEGSGGVSAFLVDLQQPGVTRTRFEDMGERAVGRGSIFFQDVAVPAAMMLGDEGRGFSQVMRGFDFSRALIGLQCLAPAAASVEETWAYVVERKAFGSPLAKFEGVSFPLAEAETKLAAARLLCYRTLWQRDQGQPHTAEAAMCKWWGPKLAFEVIQDCLLLHGHAGYGSDFPHQQRLRDVLGLQIGDGTAQIMKMIIAREKVGRVAVPY